MAMAQEISRAQRLRDHIGELASEIGERNLYQYDRLQAAAIISRVASAVLATLSPDGYTRQRNGNFAIWRRKFEVATSPER
jgi:hypothetical protein